MSDIAYPSPLQNAPAGTGRGAGGAPSGPSKVFAALARHWWSILLFTLLGAALAAGYAYSHDREYQASVDLLIDPRGAQAVGSDTKQPGGTVDGNIAIVEGQMRVLVSDIVLSPVIKAQNLNEDPEFASSGAGVFEAIRKSIRSFAFGDGEASPPSAEARAMNRLKRAVTVDRPNRSYVVQLHVKSASPEKAARLANAISTAYVESEIAAGSGFATGEAIPLDSRLRQLGDDLIAAEQRVEAHKRDNNLPDTPGGLTGEQELTEINRLMVEARDQTAAARIRMEQVKALAKSGDLPKVLPDSVQSAVLDQLRIQQTLSNQRKTTLSAKLFPSHPTMQAEELRAREIEQSIAAEIQRMARAAELEHQASAQRQSELEQRRADLTSQTNTASETQVRLRELRRDVEVRRATYEAFVRRSRELSERKETDTGEVRIISPATPPLFPSGLSPLLIMLLGSATGFGVGCIAAFSSAAMGGDQGHTRAPRQSAPRPPAPAPVNPAPPPPPVREAPEPQPASYLAPAPPPVREMPRPQPREAFDPPPVPASPPPTVSYPEGAAIPVLSILPLPRGAGDHDNLESIVVDSPNSLAAVGLQSLFDTIEQSCGSTGQNVVMVTSHSSGDFKSTIAYNLALCGALRGQKVLLVDADVVGRVLRGHLSAALDAAAVPSDRTRRASHDRIGIDCGATVIDFVAVNVGSGPSLLSDVALFDQVRSSLYGDGREAQWVIIDSPHYDATTSGHALSGLADLVLIASGDRNWTGSGHDFEGVFDSPTIRKGAVIVER